MVLKLFPGKPESFSEEDVRRIYETKSAFVLKRCRLILRNETAAEDALQEVFIRLMKYGGTIKNSDVPLSWLYRTAERVCFEILKKGQREPLTSTGLESDLLLSTSDSLAVETREVLEQFFYQLDDKLKQVALLHYLDGLSQERIGEELGWSRRTVGKKLKKLETTVERLKSTTKKNTERR